MYFRARASEQKQCMERWKYLQRKSWHVFRTDFFLYSGVLDHFIRFSSLHLFPNNREREARRKKSPAWKLKLFEIALGINSTGKIYFSIISMQRFRCVDILLFCAGHVFHAATAAIVVAVCFYITPIFVCLWVWPGFLSNLLELKSNESILYLILFSASIWAASNTVVGIECTRFLSIRVWYVHWSGNWQENKYKLNLVDHFRLVQMHRHRWRNRERPNAIHSSDYGHFANPQHTSTVRIDDSEARNRES